MEQEKNGGNKTMEKRVVVIGGGISGLMSAMTLSKHGKEVLILGSQPKL